MEKMIPANKDPEILIKESDQEFVHVKLTKRTVIPGKEQYPRIDYEVKCFKPDVFKKLEDLRYAAQPIVWYRAGGFSEAIVVHDPELWAKQRTEEEEAKKREAEERQRKEFDEIEKKEGKDAAEKKRKELEAKDKEEKRIAAELKEKEEADKDEAKKAARATRDLKRLKVAAAKGRKGQGTA